MAAAAEATAVPKDDPRLLFIQAMTDPVGRGTLVVQQLHRLRPGTGTPIQDHLLSFAAAGVGACDLATGFYVAAITGLREEGQLARVGQALLSQASTAVLLGRLDTAAAAADEGSRLLAETGHQFWLTSTQLVTAVIAGRRGEAAAATELAGKAEQVLLTAGLPPMLAQVQVARGVAALGAGRFSEAYQQLARIFDPHDTAYHPYVRSWALVDLVDAAVRSGDEQAARVRMAELAPLAAASPLLRVSLAVAAPMLAADEDAGDLYDQALRVDLNAWPLHRARLLLGYGSWLRRCRKVVDSRAPLRAARDAFDALGVVVGSERAREELLTAGEASGPLGASALQRLSPQESHIARLAAEGLTNREIGQQLYLSHRTISNHLYRIFTKLDIASRTELAAALSTGPSRG
jgi:DNA-binding CsgD family transcriptional regulator